MADDTLWHWTYWRGPEHLLKRADVPPGLYGDIQGWLERYEAGWHAEGWERLHAWAMAKLAAEDADPS